nr:FHA domain-containing protein [Nocardioides zeae]
MAEGGDVTSFAQHLGAGRPADRLPGFALAVAADAPAERAAVDVHLAARGRYVASASAETDQSVAGADAVRWNERAVVAATRFTVRAVGDPTSGATADATTDDRSDPSPAVVPTAALPLVGGVLPAQRLQTAGWLRARPEPRAPGARATPTAYVAVTDTLLRPAGPSVGVPRSRPVPPARPAPRAPRAVVPGLLCAAGHANPPTAPRCGRCTETLTGPPTAVPRPALGQLVVSTGEVVDLVEDTVVGRAPRPERPDAAPAGRLVVLPEAHVSAVHLELRLQDWSVLAVDRRSTNGTYLHRRGRPPERLTETPRELVPGDVLDLGHGAHLTFRAPPA